jgi:hypothetical protein
MGRGRSDCLGCTKPEFGRYAPPNARDDWEALPVMLSGTTGFADFVYAGAHNCLHIAVQYYFDILTEHFHWLRIRPRLLTEKNEKMKI